MDGNPKSRDRHEMQRVCWKSGRNLPKKNDRIKINYLRFITYLSSSAKYISQFQQCVCKIPEGGNQCFEYDTRFLAVSIDEALVQFPNMASYNPRPLFQPSTETSFRPSVASTKMAAASVTQETSQDRSFSGDDDDDSCNSAQCKACKLQIINGFIESGPSDSENTTLWQEKQSLEARKIIDWARKFGNANFYPHPWLLNYFLEPASPES